MAMLWCDGVGFVAGNIQLGWKGSSYMGWGFTINSQEVVSVLASRRAEDPIV